MICNTLKECTESMHHVVPMEKKKRKKGKKTASVRNKETNVYQQPLCMSPCSSESQQRRCIEFLDCRSNSTCEENGKSYTLDQSQEYPRHEVIKLHIDGGVITNPEASTVNKCDYVLLVRDGVQKGQKRNTAVLVELKGKKVPHALKQLMGTLRQLEFQPVWNSYARVFGRIVCTSSIPRIQSNDDFIEAKEAFLSKGGNLVIREESYVEEYGRL